MKNIGVFIIVTLFSCQAVGQQNDALLVKIAKVQSTKDSCCIYNIAIKNSSDSILCVLHSIFVRLIFERPIGLALPLKNEAYEDYTLGYTFADTTYNLDASPYWGEIILPYQTLNFNIRVLNDSDNGKRKRFSFEYLYLKDFSYRQFMEAMKHVGSWYYKYARMKKSIDFPN